MARKPKREIDILRAEVRKSQRLAKDKVSRLNKKGVTNLGDYNPVRYDVNLNQYTKRQLETYKSNLDQFRDRSTNFVPGTRGVAIPASVYRDYANQHKRRKKAATTFFAKVDDFKMSSTGMSYGESRKMQSPLHGVMTDPSVTPLDKLDVKSSRQFPSSRAVKKETKRIAQQNAKGFKNWTREDAMKSLKGHGNVRGMIPGKQFQAIRTRINNLSDEQFAILWHQKNFADAARMFYETMLDLLSDGDSAFSQEAQDSFIKSSRREMGDLISDVEKYSPEKGKRKRKR